MSENPKNFVPITMLERKTLMALALLMENVSKERGPLDEEFFKHLQWGIADGTYDAAVFLAKLDVEENLSGVDGIEGLHAVLQSLPEETRSAIRGEVQ